MKSVFSKTTPNFTLTANVSPDSMKLFIDVEPLEGKTASKEEIMAVLCEFVPADKININIIDDIVKHTSKGEAVKERRLRKGVEPQTGVNGKILLLVKKFTGETEVQVDAKGFAQYGNLHLFDNIRKGQTVARVYAPKPGVDGIDALDKPVKAETGKPVQLTLDNTLVLQDSPDKDHSYQILVAQIDGYLTDDQGKLVVKEEFVVKGKLDYHFGSLDFLGKVKVNGDIAPGLSIKAETGIEVLGSVRGSKLTSHKGDVIVKGFFFGGEMGKVVCGKEFSGTVLQEIEVEAVGDIKVNREALDCILRTQSCLLMPTAKLVGGNAFVVCGLEAKVIGNESGKKTTINLCSDVEMSTEYAKLVLNIESHDRAVNLMKLHLGPMATDPAKVAHLKPAHREQMQKLIAKMKEVEKSMEELKAQKSKMLEKRHANEIMRINFHAKMHDGVIVIAGEDSFELKETLTGPKSLDYNPQTRKFEVTAFKALEKKIIEVIEKPKEEKMEEKT